MLGIEWLRAVRVVGSRVVSHRLLVNCGRSIWVVDMMVALSACGLDRYSVSDVDSGGANF